MKQSQSIIVYASAPRGRRPESDAVRMEKENLNANVGSWVRAARTSADLSLDELGERTGVTRQLLSRIERGEVPAPLYLLVRIAQITKQSLRNLATYIEGA